MYFLTDEERQKLLKGILPKSRSIEVAPELRGWNWYQPPLEPVYEVALAVYELAGKYCSTGRDVYLRRVQCVRGTPNKDMIVGSAFHETLANILVRAKRLVYTHGVDHLCDILKGLQEPAEAIVEKRKCDLSTEDYVELVRRVNAIHGFEVARLATRIQEAVAKQPYIREDSLVSTAIPVMVEQRLDGSFLLKGHPHYRRRAAAVVHRGARPEGAHDIRGDRSRHRQGLLSHVPVQETLHIGSGRGTYEGMGFAGKSYTK